MRIVTPAIFKGTAPFNIWFAVRFGSANGIILYAEKVGHNKFFGLSIKEGYLELR